MHRDPTRYGPPLGSDERIQRAQPEHRLPPDGENVIAVAVAFVAAQPGGSERVLRQHAEDPLGYCTSCGVGVLPVRWPCTVAAIAMAARESADTAQGAALPRLRPCP